MKHILHLPYSRSSIKLLLLGGTMFFSLWGCRQDLKEEAKPSNSANNPLNPIAASSYSNANSVDVLITGKDASGNPLRMSNIEIYTKDPLQGGKLLTRGFTSFNGLLASKLQLSKDIQEVYVKTNFIGLIEGVSIPVSGSRISYDFRIPGGLSGGRIEANCDSDLGTPYLADLSKTSNPPLAASQSFNDADGVPCYKIGGTISNADFFNGVNAQLPEGKNGIQGQYYVNKSRMNSDYAVISTPRQGITVTFVGENASRKNALGYYYYPDKTKPPTTIEEVNQLKPRVLVPNASLVGSGGGLKPGDKFKLVFDSGQKVSVGGAIGWFIVTNGWQSNGSIKLTGTESIFFSNASLNPEDDQDFTTHFLNGTSVTRSLKQHMAAINYSSGQFLDVFGANGGTVFGFEDLRNLSTRKSDGDADFNDVVFFATPASDFPEAKDVQGGLVDVPKAKGTLLFEDLWPSMGDFDMNDFVTDYDCTYKIYQAGYQIIDGVPQPPSGPDASQEGDVKQININFLFRAMGAGYHNAFGIQLPIISSSVNEVYFTEADGVTKLATNPDGTNSAPLAGEDFYTYMLFTDVYRSITGSTNTFVNVYNDQDQKDFKVINMVITLKPGVKEADFNYNNINQGMGIVPPFNPFILADNRVNYEVHLPGFKPTKRAQNHTPLKFGGGTPATLNVGGYTDVGVVDNTYAQINGNTIYYLTKPTADPKTSSAYFALNISTEQLTDGSKFGWPLERVLITDAYPEFSFFYSSGGVDKKDWYLHPDVSKIYIK